MSDRERLTSYVEIWHRACADFVALARTLPDDAAQTATDLQGWDVHDVVAHIAHLEAVLAGAPEESIDVAQAPHIKGIQGFYTEQGVLARRERGIAELADEIESSVATRYAALEADPPVDATGVPPRTPGGIGWDNQTLLANRPLDVWMHEQDIRRAIDRPGGYDSPAAVHTLHRLGAGLPMVLGKRVAPPSGTSVVIEVPDADFRVGAQVGANGRAVLAEPPEPSARIVLTPEAFVVLAGGRRAAETVEAKTEGDLGLARAVLENLAVTP